jgi:hypothetical protein
VWTLLIEGMKLLIEGMKLPLEHPCRTYYIYGYTESCGEPYVFVQFGMWGKYMCTLLLGAEKLPQAEKVCEKKGFRQERFVLSEWTTLIFPSGY